MPRTLPDKLGRPRFLPAVRLPLRTPLGQCLPQSRQCSPPTSPPTSRPPSRPRAKRTSVLASLFATALSFSARTRSDAGVSGRNATTGPTARAFRRGGGWSSSSGGGGGCCARSPATVVGAGGAPGSGRRASSRLRARSLCRRSLSAATTCVFQGAARRRLGRCAGRTGVRRSPAARRDVVADLIGRHNGRCRRALPVHQLVDYRRPRVSRLSRLGQHLGEQPPPQRRCPPPNLCHRPRAPSAPALRRQGSGSKIGGSHPRG